MYLGIYGEGRSILRYLKNHNSEKPQQKWFHKPRFWIFNCPMPNPQKNISTNQESEFDISWGHPKTNFIQAYKKRMLKVWFFEQD